jgi:hypothetical protein
LESFSDDVRSTCHTGAKVPCTQPPAACLASLLKSFEWFSSTLDLENINHYAKETGGITGMHHPKENCTKCLCQ